MVTSDAAAARETGGDDQVRVGWRAAIPAGRAAALPLQPAAADVPPSAAERHAAGAAVGCGQQVSFVTLSRWSAL